MVERRKEQGKRTKQKLVERKFDERTKKAQRLC